ncbi:agamous-like MADS-box protein AGL62 [Cajanus cajan]|uniref:agamous-like MADS-box protein AGL62 n=1 Tax=Cajanus cajan TaxID=3821 RepID=UPI00098D75CC|nr:agamous-like MADS-box protein AGL62 [Cajanus cajan]
MASGGTTSSRKRRSTEIKEVKQKNKRHATFCKRKQGLFNKLTELSLLCDVKTALIIISPSDMLYSCGYPDADAVLRRYLGVGGSLQRNHCVKTHARACVGGDLECACKTNEKERIECESLRVEYEATQNLLKAETKRLQAMTKAQTDSCFDPWWNLPTEGMSLESLQTFKASLESLKLNLVAAVQEKQLFTSVSPTSHVLVPPPQLPNMS